MAKDPYDSLVNQELYAQWDLEAYLARRAEQDTCLNGNLCTHPFCVDHEIRDYWDKNDWPVAMSRSDEMRSIEEGTAEQWLR